MNQLSIEKTNLVNNELNSDESLKWSDAPNPARHAMKGLPMTLFGIPFTAFSIFWICGAAGFSVPDFSQGGFSFFPLFGLPFFCVGMGIMLTPLWMYLKAKKAVYAITSKRAIIMEGIFSLSIRSFYKQDLGDLERKQHSDGSGDIIFKREMPGYGNRRGGFQGVHRSQLKAIGFIGIQNVKSVENLLSDIEGD